MYESMYVYYNTYFLFATLKNKIFNTNIIDTIITTENNFNFNFIIFQKENLNNIVFIENLTKI